jgi:hypothetical protein
MDYAAKALSRVIWQYKNSPKFLQWIQTIPQIIHDELELPAETIINIPDIDASEGELLDIVGRIVGQERNHPLLLDDEVYHIIIKSKIFKNNSIALIDDIVEAAENITGAQVLQLSDNQDMSFSIVFAENLSDLMVQLLVTFDLIPRPQGVQLSGFVNPPDGLFFGFSEPGMATPGYIAGFGEIYGDGLWALELSDGALLEVNDEYLLGLSELDNPALIGGGRFVELVGVL